MSRIVQQVLEYHLKVPLANIAGPARINEDLGADSLDCVEICMDIEDKMGIMITDAEIEEVHTVQDLYDLVQKKQDEKNPPPAMEKPKDENTA